MKLTARNLNNHAQSPSRVIVVSHAGQEHVNQIAGSDKCADRDSLVVFNPAPEASPPSSPSPSQTMLVMC